MNGKISVLQNVNTVFKHPYPHVCVDEALPDYIYKELAETFPQELVCSTQPHDGGITYRISLTLHLLKERSVTYGKSSLNTIQALITSESV